MNGYRIEIAKKSPMGCLTVTLIMSGFPGIKGIGDRKIIINVGDDGTVNIPPTGDLSAEEDMPAFLEALDLATKLASRDIEIQGLSLEIQEIPIRKQSNLKCSG